MPDGRSPSGGTSSKGHVGGAGGGDAEHQSDGDEREAQQQGGGASRSREVAGGSSGGGAAAEGPDETKGKAGARICQDGDGDRKATKRENVNTSEEVWPGQASTKGSAGRKPCLFSLNVLNKGHAAAFRLDTIDAHDVAVFQRYSASRPPRSWLRSQARLAERKGKRCLASPTCKAAFSWVARAHLPPSSACNDTLRNYFCSGVASVEVGLLMTLAGGHRRHYDARGFPRHGLRGRLAPAWETRSCSTRSRSSPRDRKDGACLSLLRGAKPLQACQGDRAVCASEGRMCCTFCSRVSPDPSLGSGGGARFGAGAGLASGRVCPSTTGYICQSRRFSSAGCIQLSQMSPSIVRSNAGCLTIRRGAWATLRRCKGRLWHNWGCVALALARRCGPAVSHQRGLSGQVFGLRLRLAN